MKKYEIFQAALRNLKDVYSYQEPYSNVVIIGMVGLFKICFEQSWKAMKEILEEHGYEEGATGSPRMILKTTYNEAIAIDIINQTKEKYYAMFVRLSEIIEQNWI